MYKSLQLAIEFSRLDKLTEYLIQLQFFNKLYYYYQFLVIDFVIK